jgi:hypothetical protein
MRFVSMIIAAVFATLAVCFLGYAVTHYNPWANMIALIGGLASAGVSYISIMHIMGDLS